MDKKESRLVIRRDCIENNVRAVRQLTGARLMAVVKEDGYGIGIASAYRILSGCGVDFFCVGTPREALTLRNLGFSGVPVPFVHAAASRTLAWAGDLGYDGVRIGSLLLGKETEGRADFQDAVRLEAKICEKKWYPAGEYAGYRRDVKLKRDSLIGVVRAGCGDGLGLARQSREPLGLLRHAVRNMFFPDHAYCLFGNGSRVPILDNTGTGHTLVDLTGLGLNPGDVLSFRINPLLADPDIPKIIVGDGEGIKDAASF